MSLPSLDKEDPLDSKSSGSHSTGIVTGHELTNAADLEKGEAHDRFPRADTVRFGAFKHDEDDIELADTSDREHQNYGVNPGDQANSSKRLTLHRTHSIGSLNRGRFQQSNKVIGDFKTMSIQLSQGGLADSEKVSQKRVKGAKRGGRSEKKTLKDIADLDWHRLSAQETMGRLGVLQQSGLDAAQVKRRLDSDGPNRISKPPSNWLRKIFNYVLGGFGSLLVGASAICFLAWRIGDPPQASNLALAVVLLVVVLVTSFFNAWQDFTTSRVMESVRGMLPSDVVVLRDGSLHNVPAADIVRGDIIEIKMGAKVAADCRILSIESEIKFDRSSLTGESDAIAATIDSTEDNYLESRNVVMAGTKCVAGQARAIVTATGDTTVFGRLAKLSSTPKKERTTLEKEIFYFVLTIASLAVTVAVACIIIWAAYLRPKHPNFMSVSSLLVNVVSILVAFIPEGLPCAVSLSLTAVAARMRRAHVLVKSLSIVETLGAVNVVCSDKTGTLTQNHMSIRACAVHGFEEDDVEEAKRHVSLDTPIGHAFLQLQWLAGMCNAATFDDAETEKINGVEERAVHGDATDTACLRFSQFMGGDVDRKRQAWTTTQQMAFNSKHKFALRLLKANASLKDPIVAHEALSQAEAAVFNTDSDLILLTKGAPDVLFGRCISTLDASGSIVELTEARKRYLETVQQSWANTGKRVLLLARRIVSLPANTRLGNEELSEKELMELNNDLTIVGLVGIVDPPRPEIVKVVKTVRGAGSRFFMVTGDFQNTAVAIARQCGIITTEKVATYDDIEHYRTKEKIPSYDFEDPSNDERPQRAMSLNGFDVMRLQPTDWDVVCNFDEIVFCRTTPDQKLRIVKEFQARDGVVAMTGDGVNDAPALKQADCGIAMGGGSEVAIEAADLVLLDTFASFVDALLYGRVCFDNLKKTVAYLLPAGSFAELWAVLLSFFFGLPQMLSNIQMILICCLTDLFPSLSLIQEQAESDVLKRKPRNVKKDRLANPQLLIQAYVFVGIPLTVCSCAMSFWWMQRQGVPFSDMWFKYGGGQFQTNDPSRFNEILYQANAVYFFTLVIQQYFDLLALRTRRLSLFQQNPLWGSGRNRWLFAGMLASFCLAIFFSYIRPIQSVFLTRGIPAEYFFLPMAFGLVTLSFDEARKLVVRSHPHGLVARLAW